MYLAALFCILVLCHFSCSAATIRTSECNRHVVGLDKPAGYLSASQRLLQSVGLGVLPCGVHSWDGSWTRLDVLMRPSTVALAC
ncbi:hypothetical protein QR685DRAFT_115954 [Neurospora intermedia]|uniref:Secreted protein n=1 Tax=Neurospora intermedia TaxID=5142 RepID=A0ABR3D017_NEUIN